MLIDSRAMIGANQLADFNTILGDGGGSGSTFYLTGAAAGTYSFAGKTVDGRIHFTGSTGTDTITGSSGNDWISGGTGADHISAGAGNDTVYVAAGDAQTSETLDGGADSDTLLLDDQANLAPDKPTRNFETLLIDNRATIGANQIADCNTISGEGGSSGSIFTLYGTAPGVFDFSGKTVESRIHFIGSRGNDTITGSSGNDWLNGGSSGVEHFTIVANATLTASDYTFV